MNILVVTAYPPVLHMHGGGVRMYHNIRILSGKHRVRVLSFVENDEELDMLRSVADICDSVTAVRRVPDFRPHWLSVKPFMVREFSTPQMHRAVDEALRTEQIDVVQCEYLQMAQFRRRGVFSVLTAHETLSKNALNAFVDETKPAEKLRLFYRWMQMLRYEVGEMRKFDRIVAMTEEDARYLKSYTPAADVRAIPIGIDPAEFAPLAEDPLQPIVALFVGNFRHLPNIEAVRFIVERIAPRFPDMQFLIPGPHAPAALNPGPNVILPGYIADTRCLYRRPNTIVLAPLFLGTGQRVKLLEAFSMACPVITTRVGALGYPIESGVQAIIADTADEFESALRMLIASPEDRRGLGEKAREMIVRQFSWERIGSDLMDAVANGHGATIPLLGKGGVAAPSNEYRRRHPLKGADGVVRSTTAEIYSEVDRTTPNPSFAKEVNFGADPRILPSPYRKLLFPIKAITFVWRFLVLLTWTVYLEGSRVIRG